MFIGLSYLWVFFGIYVLSCSQFAVMKFSCDLLLMTSIFLIFLPGSLFLHIDGPSLRALRQWWMVVVSDINVIMLLQLLCMLFSMMIKFPLLFGCLNLVVNWTVHHASLWWLVRSLNATSIMLVLSWYWHCQLSHFMVLGYVSYFGLTGLVHLN